MFGVEEFSQKIVTSFSGSEIGTAALFGGSMVLIGMLTIFLVLCIIWACLALFKVVFQNISEKKTESAVVVEEAPVAAPVQTVSSDDEIVAVIAAAIAMAESENSGLKFRVVSFKRK